MTTEVRRHFEAQSKAMKILQLIKLLHTERHTIGKLADKLETTERTIYRYLIQLEFMDLRTEKDMYNKYFIVQGHCPLCGITTNNHSE